MNKKTIIIGLIAMMAISLVSAECTPYEEQLFTDCYGYNWFDMEYLTHCHVYDYPINGQTDGVINLIDLGMFQNQCNSKNSFSIGGKK